MNPSAPIPALYAFLQRRTDTFACSQLPADLAPVPLGITQALYRYLMAAVAIDWRLAGVSWSGLAPLYGAMFGVTLCAAYGLFRLAAGPLVAVVGVVPFAVSAHHLGYLAQLRDYAKAPFILLLILLLAHMAVPPLRPRRSLALAAAFGLILGIGFGFRNDLLINLPPFLFTVVVLTPESWIDHLGLKAACLALASTLFIISAWPILAAYRTGSNTGHVGVLGLMSTFDAPLGLTRPPYDLGSHYLDGYAATVIDAHSAVWTGRSPEYLSGEYDAAAFQLLVRTARHWPADIYARGLASVSQVLDFPFTADRYTPSVPPGVRAPAIVALYKAQRTVLLALTGLGPFLASAAVIIVGSMNPRAGIALVFFLLYYCGYPALQFHVRHFFHLEFIAWWSLVFLLAAVGRFILRRLGERPLPQVAARRVVDGLLVAAVLAGVTVMPLGVLRVYQQRHLVTLFASYLRSPRAPLAISRATRGGTTLITVDGLWNGVASSDPPRVRYLVLEFSSDRCPAVDLPVAVKYDAKTPSNDFSFVRRMPIDPAGPTFGFIPAYANGEWSRFAAFSVPAGYEGCLKSVAIVNDLGRIPVVVALTLPPQWRSATWFQRLVKVEAERRTDTLVQTVPDDLAVPAAGATKVVEKLVADDLGAGVASNAARGSWFTPAPVPLSTAHQRFLQFAPRYVGDAMVLRADGELRYGGLRIATVRSGQRVDSRAITTPGPFTVFIAVPTAGDYSVRVTDEAAVDWRQDERSVRWRLSRALVPWTLRDDFELHDVAWIASPGLAR